MKCSLTNVKICLCWCTDMKILIYDKQTCEQVGTINDPYSFYEASTHYLVSSAVDDIVCIETVIPKTDYFCMIAD